ncbi:chemotaxis protein [Propylenella binzhouense]|uniref:chemotaxis protein n=1 Tax=Propylenella binzhouense TaxID=2555902 RepID=UPI00136E5165|nr:chemotaxis protein [Propylenella binzhouense]
MRVRALSLAIATAASLAAAAPACAEAGQEPFRLLRGLQALQGRVAAGDDKAQKAQPELLRAIGRSIAAASEAAWEDPRNVRAVLLYALSGGGPEPLRRLKARGTDRIPPALLEGAIAFTEGRNEAARKALAGIDPLALPAGTGGHIALVKAMVEEAADPAAADRLLDVARLLSPGTLIEEAALRRQAVLASGRGDYDRFAFLSGQYFRRFRHSAYAPAFLPQFAAAVVGFEFPMIASAERPIVSIIAGLDTGTRRALYLAIARAAAISGKADHAILTADRAAALSGPGTAERARADLYAAAVLIATEAYDLGIGKLAGVDAALLGSADRDLLRAATALSARLREWPADAPAGALPAEGQGPDPDLAVRGKKAVAEADALLASLQ